MNFLCKKWLGGGGGGWGAVQYKTALARLHEDVSAALRNQEHVAQSWGALQLSKAAWSTCVRSARHCA